MSAASSNGLAPSMLADLRAGFLVCLIALPLCLGIAMASGFPPIAGVVTAIVGGLVVSLLGSARLTIKGPAAGLIVVAVGAVQELGQGDLTAGYHRALAVGVAAAVIQIVLALLRAATAGIAISPTVVHGMLAAIGVLIVSKQVHTVVGVTPDAQEPLGLLAEIPSSLAHANPRILIIGAVSLAVLLVWPLLRRRWLKAVPAPLVVLALAVPLGLYFDLPQAHDYDLGSGRHHVGPEFLVELPGSLFGALVFPDFSMLFTAASLKYVVMFALVGSIESTLSVLAVDAMDPERRASKLNRDLLGTGIGNLVCALIGGLPMISEIVRSRANIDSGARSHWANFFHGGLLLVFVAAAPGLLQAIPLAALAAMLVYVGIRLASPREVALVGRIGMDQLLLFTVTLVVTLSTDLLIGVGAGLLLDLVLHLRHGARLRELFRAQMEVERTEGRLALTLHGAAVFNSVLVVRRALQAAAGNPVDRVVIDLRDVVLVDHTFLFRVHGMVEELPGAEIELVGLDDMEPASQHRYATRRRRR